MGEIPTSHHIEKLEVTVLDVIGSAPKGHGREGSAGTSYTLVTLKQDEQQKYLAVATQGSDEVELIPVKDREDAENTMFEHLGKKLGVKK